MGYSKLTVVAGFPEALGRTIRLNREIRGFTLLEMARHQDMSMSGWSRVETGKTEIRSSQLIRAASLFHVPAWQLVKDAEELISRSAEPTRTET